MRQVILRGPGELAVVEVPAPEPGAGEVVVEILAALTCGTDLKVWRRGGHPRMIVAPSPFGHELCGRVVRRGAGVNDWPVGTVVACSNSAPCGDCEPCRSGRDNLCLAMAYLNGAYGDELLIPAAFVAKALRLAPAGLAPELVALAEPLACVHHGITVLRPSPGEAIAVLGCGPIGLLFVAELASRGAEVVALDPNPSRLEVARRLGATHTSVVVDRRAPQLPIPVAAIVEATGSLDAWSAVPGLLRPGGRALFFGGVPAGLSLAVDAVRLHYEELALLGAYHYTRTSFDTALARLGRDGETLRPLLTGSCDLDGVGRALESMASRDNLKVVVV